MRIVFTGTHGTGKTTLLENMKKDHLLPTYEYICNLTRDVMRRGFPINKEGDDRTQLALLAAHLNTFNKDDFVIDRCLLDICSYNRYLRDMGIVCREVVGLADAMLEDSYRNYDIIFYLKPEFGIVSDGIRSTDVEYQHAVARHLDDLISKYGIPVVPLTGTVEERMAQVKSTLAEVLVA